MKGPLRRWNSTISDVQPETLWLRHIKLTIGTPEPLTADMDQIAQAQTIGKGTLVPPDLELMPNSIAIANDGVAMRFEPVRHCIYCGAMRYAPDSDRRLGDEHIVPEGAGGTLILPEASCKLHEDLTKRIEGSILRTVLWAPRHKLGVRRKKRKREEGSPFEIFTEVNGRLERVVLPADIHPTMLFLPILQMPEFARRRPPWESGLKSFYVRALGDFKASGLERYTTPALDTLRFCQMLAKIAYTFAYAASGIFFEPFLCPLIELQVQHGHNWKGRYRLVGGFLDDRPASSALHELALVHIGGGPEVYLGVKIRLFANLAAPRYFVVVGKLPPGTTPSDLHSTVRLPRTHSGSPKQ